MTIRNENLKVGFVSKKLTWIKEEPLFCPLFQMNIPLKCLAKFHISQVCARLLKSWQVSSELTKTKSCTGTISTKWNIQFTIWKIEVQIWDYRSQIEPIHTYRSRKQTQKIICPGFENKWVCLTVSPQNKIGRSI